MKLTHKAFDMSVSHAAVKRIEDFINEIGRENLETLTGHSDYRYGGSVTGRPGLIIVWYWKDNDEE